ncbi:MAG: exosortase/archaeosortase family protein, partial [Phycisphaerae bacterium]|nr:exosortase/archaeosortase family protein [Phycisphaerae bacterium]
MTVAPRGGEADAVVFPRPMDIFTRGRIAKIVILAIPFFWLFHGTMWRLFRVWWEIPDWSHGLLIPAFSVGIFLYIHDRWRNVPLRAAYSGLLVVLASFLVYIVAVWWLKLAMLQDYAWWLMLFGLVITLCGWKFTRAVWFPLAFIGFGIRIGGVAYNKMSGTLQVIAAHCSTLILKLLRINADIEGVIIDVFTRSGQQYPMQVAEACSGMRILMAFMALGSLIAYVVRRPWWHRLILVLAILPIAVLSNVVRVTGMGILYYFDKKEWATGFAHTLEGMLMLPLAFLMFWLLHWVLCKLVIEVPGPEQDGEDAHGAPANDSPPPLLAEVGATLSADGQGLAVGDRRVGQWLRTPSLARQDAGRGWRALAPDLREPHFRTLALVMFSAAILWGFASLGFGLVFNKQAVPLRQMLDAFPRKVASKGGNAWLATSLSPPAEEPQSHFTEVITDLAVEKFLGATHPYRLRGNKNFDPKQPDPAPLLTTPQYIQRTYKLVDAGGQDVPGRQAYFFISYYTGEPDVVPHVPERCYLGAGWREVKNIDRDLTIPDPKNPGTPRQIPVRFVQFGKGEEINTVAYLLCFNGQISSSHNEVRWKLNSPLGKYAYYSKIEMKFWNLKTLDEIIPAV